MYIIIIARIFLWRYLFGCAHLAIPILLFGCADGSPERASFPASEDRDIHAAAAASPQPLAPDQSPAAPGGEPPARLAKPNLARAVGTPSGPYVLAEPSTINVYPGTPSPKVGDLIYTMANLPANTCGEFWVRDGDGYVSKLALCTGQHEGGH